MFLPKSKRPDFETLWTRYCKKCAGTDRMWVVLRVVLRERVANEKMLINQLQIRRTHLPVGCTICLKILSSQIHALAMRNFRCVSGENLQNICQSPSNNCANSNLSSVWAFGGKRITARFHGPIAG